MSKYYAGLYLLVNKQWHNEVQFLLEAIKKVPGWYGPEYRAKFPGVMERTIKGMQSKLALLRSGRKLAQSPGFKISFDDLDVGASLRAHARSHGIPC